MNNRMKGNIGIDIDKNEWEKEVNTRTNQPTKPLLGGEAIIELIMCLNK